MEKVKSFKSITYILSGSLLYIFNGLAGGWTSGLAAIFGFIIFIMGLNMLKSELDPIGRSAVGLLLAGAAIGGFSSAFALIPMVGNLSGIGFIFAYVLKMVGFFQLKKSTSLGQAGKDGATRLIAAMVIAVLGSFISMFPFVGNIAASIFALISMLLVFTGWLKVQDGITVLEPVKLAA